MDTDAALLLYRFKHHENSGVSHEDVAQAREVLQAEFARVRGWTRVDWTTQPGVVWMQDFLRDFLPGLLSVEISEPFLAGLLGLETGERMLPPDGLPESIPHGDWVDFWRDETGQPVAVTSHYYGVNADELRELLDFTEKFGLELTLDGHGSWKNAGHAIIVIMERQSP